MEEVVEVTAEEGTAGSPDAPFEETAGTAPPPPLGTAWAQLERLGPLAWVGAGARSFEGSRPRGSSWWSPR